MTSAGCITRGSISARRMCRFWWRWIPEVISFGCLVIAYNVLLYQPLTMLLWCSFVYTGAFIMQDRDLNEYSPSGSNTSEHVSCSHELCTAGPNCKGAKQPCPYSVEYLSENTSSSGLLVEDILHLVAVGTGVSKSSIRAPVIVGCGMKQSGGYLEGIAPDGLMGLGLGDISVPSFLAKAGLIKNSFSMCIDEEGFGGRIFFGDQGPNTQHSTSFLPSNGNYETYVVGVEACCVGNTCLKQTSFRALIDSGTSFTFLPEVVYDKIVVEFDKRVNATITSFEGVPWKYCYKTSSQDLLKVPSMTLMFLANNSLVVNDPIFPIHGNQGVVGFCLAIQPADGDSGTIGQNFMTGYRTVFDRENMKLGWSRSKCQDFDDAKSMPLTPSPKGTPPNPLPTTEQQSSPGGFAPAVAGRAPPKASAAYSRSKFCFLRWMALIVLFHIVFVF
ncbi:aspartic proteinase-like protein 1 isoform X2 [Argentina anserina]|uniref:aspartic proteinase-like protein 1 isoform X2 n=1 Tax=Argentina anserina TaxID=57926 RepID=UPI0021768660|nr:aspartic proteinase-like protein 1 isoform X2 [Potentilla anserina]